MIVTVLCYPWIIDAVLWHYLKEQAVTVEKREVNYSGVTYAGIKMARNGAAVTIESVSLPSLASLAGFTGNSEPVLIKGVFIDLPTAKPEETPAENPLNMNDLLGIIFKTLPRMEQVMPDVRINGATLAYSSDNQLIFDRIQWRAGQLTVHDGSWSGQLPDQLREMVLKPQLTYLRLGRRGSDMLYVTADFSNSLILDGSLAPGKDGRPTADIQAHWEAGQLDLMARWNDAGWLPAECEFTASGTSFPFLTGNPSAPFQPKLEIAADYNLQTSDFSLQLEGAGHYIASETTQSSLPWNLSILANGDADKIQFSTLKIDLPGLRASLNNNLILDRSNWVPYESACFEWDLDLSTGFLSGLDGAAEGTVCLDPAWDNNSADFRLSGTAADLVLPSQIWPEPINSVEVSGDGTFDSETLHVARLAIDAADLVRVTGDLEWDWQAQLPGALSLEGRLLPQFVARWLAREQAAVPEEGFAIRFNGNHQDSGWEHSGALTGNSVTLRGTYDVDLELQWQGNNLTIESWTAEIDHDDLALSGSGFVDWQPGRVEMRIDKFNEQQGTELSWSLADPVTFLFTPGGLDAPASLDCGPLKLEFQDGGKVTLEGRWSGWNDITFNGEVTDLALSNLDAWIDNARLLSSSIDQLRFSLNSEHGQDGSHSWSGNGDFQAKWISRENLLVAGSGGWSIADTNIGFRELTIEVDGTEWFTIDGILPLSLYGTAERPIGLQIAEDDPLEIKLKLKPVETLPRLIAESIPFKIGNLQARAVASGTLSRPEAEILANAGTLSWRGKADDSLYTVNDVYIDAAIDMDSLRLQRLSLRLPDARKAESINAEISNIDWIALIRNTRNYPWNELAGSVKIDRWPVVSLGSFLPKQFLSQGQFSVILEKEPGKWPVGDLNFKGLSWRALDAGIIAREIAGKAHLQGRKVEQLEMTASVGGGVMRISGWMDFNEIKDPRFRIRLQSDRFDLVRRSSLILRGRSDLEAVYENKDTVPRLQGDIELIRSLWLRDLQDFTRKGTAGVSQRPPYFSVKAEPFARWQLDLNIFGEKFLRLQSTLLTGTASTEFNLRGTLGDPILVGNVSLADGAIIFPFANLKNTGIEAWITEDEPHTIKLSGSGEGVVYGYIVQYQLSGTSEMPAITFTSVPSLAQYEILLMLTTGAVPSAEITTNINERTRRIGFFIGQDIFSSLIGRDGASRLEFRTGDGFSPFRREGQLLEYQINDKWSIIGEYDDFGGYNVDVRRIIIKR